MIIFLSVLISTVINVDVEMIAVRLHCKEFTAVYDNSSRHC